MGAISANNNFIDGGRLSGGANNIGNEEEFSGINLEKLFSVYGNDSGMK